jgi:RNA polymerase sigma-70 factor (ECF subfamily)
MVSAQSGNEKDYQRLLQELSEVIDRYLRSRIGHHHFIEDCVQDTLVAIHKARHTYDPGRRFRPWLFAIVRHKAIDTLRHQRSQRDAVERYREELEVTGSQRENAPADDGGLPGKLMAALSPQHREAITLTKIKGLSTAQAAATLRISEGALKVRIHRAIGRLKRLVETEAL